MVRRSLFLPALVAAGGLLATGWTLPAQAAATTQAPRYDPALEVTITSLTPGEVPTDGPIRVSGEVTNRDDVPWVGISLYGVLGDQPLRTAEELAEAAETDPTTPVGDRIIEEGTFDTVDDLDPGESALFSFAIDRDLLPVTAPGVYWFGVQALGESTTTPDDANSDGRARTFVPFIPPETPGRLKTALVLPLRHFLPYAEDGSIADLEHWQRTLSSDGRLHELVEFAASAGSAPVTWLVDPALPDAVRRLGLGNPPRSLAATDPPPGEDPEQSPGGEPSADDEAGADTGAGPEAPRQLTEEEQAVADAALAWLERTEEAMAGDEVLALPYGDLDVAAAAVLSPDLYDVARERPGDLLTQWGVDTRPAVLSPTGYLNEAGLDLAPDDATVLVTDRMFAEDPPGVADVDGRTVGVISSGAAAGGPGPGDRFTTLQLRQRILSEAALRLVAPGRHPLMVSLPVEWQPGEASSFFAGLDVDWLDLTTVDDATSRDGRAVSAAELDYPITQQRRQLDAPAFAAVDDLIDAGETLQNLLTRNSRVSAAVTDQALAGASYGARGVQLEARASLDASRAWIDDQLGEVSITAGPGVTLSGNSGGFATVIENDLAQPVTVNVVGVSNGGVEITPVERFELAADSRSTVVLEASANRVGVTNVTLALTDLEGNPIGATDRLPIRSAQVSVVIWLIIGTGVALLFLAIAVRLFRRIRNARREPAATEGAEDDHDATEPTATQHPTPLESAT